MVRQLEERSAARKSDPYCLAIAYAALGERDKTFAALNRSVDQGSGMVAGLNGVRSLRALSDDPRYSAVLPRLGIPN